MVMDNVTMRNSAYGKANVSVVVFSGLFIIFAGLSGFSYSKITEEQKKNKSIQESNKQALKKLSQAKDTLAKISNLVGFYQPLTSGGFLASDPKTIKSRIEDFCARVNEQNRLGLNLRAQTIDEEQLSSGQLDYIKSIVKLDTIWEECIRRIEEMKEQCEAAKKRHKEEQASYEQEAQNTVAEINRLERVIQDKRREIEENRKKSEEQLQEEEKKRGEAQESKVQEKEKLASLIQRKRLQRQKYENELENLDGRIAEIQAETAGQTGIERWFREETVTQKVQETPDGEIIYVDEKDQTAYIDLGRKEGISKGVTFQVFRYGKGGVREHKGNVVVRKVEENISMVGIVETKNPLDPLTKGDKIINPVYDRNKVRFFVVAGRLQKYSLDQASRVVAKLGGKVEREISAKTDFVVLGEGFKSDPIYQMCTERGIETMLESEFVTYLGE